MIGFVARWVDRERLDAEEAPHMTLISGVTYD